MMRRTFLAGAGSLATGGCARLSEEELARRWPPLGQMVEVDGLPVHAWDRGTGPGRPVILIHGASGNLRDWTFALAPELAKSMRVIAFDRPGFGWSARLPERGWEPARQAAHLAAAARKLGVEDAILVGHSWGAALAMAWALDHPDQVGGVVTLGGATMPWGGRLSSFYGLIASDLVGGLAARVISATLSEARIAGFLGEVFEPQPVPSEYAEDIGGPLATRPETLRGNAKDVRHLNDLLKVQAGRYFGLDIPVEILHGTADTTVWPGIHAERMHAALPNSRLALLEGVGHMPHHASPDQVLAAVARLQRA